jgi:hypothetical protein
MGSVTRRELEEAYGRYRACREEASRTGDWSPWAEQFTEDAHYVEHAYGELRGREAIRDWITRVMAPFPHMTFPDDWVVFDPERGWVVFQCQNRLAHPADAGGEPFQFPSWSLLHYAGGFQWSYEEDMYNPADGAAAISAWRRAGGRFESPELVRMTRR